MVSKTRHIAVWVIEVFEQMLEEKGITIPSLDREGNKEEARIYGSEYYLLEDGITDILRYEINKINYGCPTELKGQLKIGDFCGN